METSKREVDQHRVERLRKSESANRQTPSQNKQTFPVETSGENNAAAAAAVTNDTDDVTFFEDFVAGGLAGSASVVVGHPFDTVKVRMQTSASKSSIFANATSYGGVTSLFRGMGPPLSAAAVVNAIIFSSYGASSRLYDQFLEQSSLESRHPLHDSTLKAFTCGSFAGLVQCVVICPMEHIKCRLQVQHGKGSPDNLFKGPFQAVHSIVRNHGMRGLFRGWWITALREVPAFGMYFSFYDYCKDQINSFLSKYAGPTSQEDRQRNVVSGSETFSLLDGSSVNDYIYLPEHSHAWLASAMSGGLTGALTWGVIYPVDIVKTRIQTSPLAASPSELQMITVAKNIVAQHGWRHLFRGLNITLIRAFPVNGIIFPVYEFSLMQLANLEY